MPAPRATLRNCVAASLRARSRVHDSARAPVDRRSRRLHMRPVMGDRIAQEAKALERHAGMRALDDHVVIAFSGEDAHTWLGGQVTNQVTKTKPGDAVYALFTNVKGKVLADAFIVHVTHDEEDDLLYAVVPSAAREALLESFDKYIVMEDVDVAVRDDLAVLTVQGPAAGELVGLVPAALEASWPCDRLGTGGRDVIASRETLAAIAAELAAAGAAEVSEAGWELARLRLGVPRFGIDFGPETYPQEAGLARRAVSFTKGCYLGQEVVCMLENRGKVSKRLVSLELPGGAPTATGTPILDGEREVGRATSAAADPDEGVVRALAMIKAAVAEPGRALRVGNAEGRLARVVD